MKLDILPCW